MDAKIKLAACSFCGSDSSYVTYRDCDGWGDAYADRVVECAGCYAQGPTASKCYANIADEVADVIQRWNQRRGLNSPQCGLRGVVESAKMLYNKEVNMIIDVLGQPYKVLYRQRDDDPLLAEWSGYTDRTSKEIVVCCMKRTTQTDVDNLDTLMAEALRHEIVHVFLFESGLEEYGRDEVIVQWIAMQLPKINKAIKQTER